MTTQIIKVGICGLGTVGQGVIALLSEGGDVLSNRVGGTIELVHVATRTHLRGPAHSPAVVG